MPKPDNKPFTGRIYSYLRFSTPEQQLGDSERRQLDLAQKFAEDLGTTLDETLIDRGLSGYHGVHKTRGHLGRFLEKVERGQIPPDSILVIENVDRLSREPIVDAFTTFSGLLKSGVNIQTLCPMQLYDLDALNGGLIYQLIGQMHRANEESQRKSERVRAARENAVELARQGGKMITSQCPAWLKASPQKKFEKIPEAAVAIKRIYDLKLQGVGYGGIAKKLNGETGWKPSNGWRHSYIKKIIQNRAVIGEFQPHQLIDGKRQPTGDPVTDYYPQVVDTTIFYAVQKQLKGNRGKGGRTGKAKNLFSYLVKCAYCGGPMAFVDKGPLPTSGKYLVCDKARCGYKCTTPSIRYDEAERTILANCQGLNPEQVLPDPDEQTKQIQALRLELQGVMGSLEATKPQIDNLVDRVAQTTSESLIELYEEKIGQLEQDKASLLEQHRKIEQELKKLQSTRKSFARWKKGLKTLLKSLDDIEIRLKLRLHLRELIDHIDVYPAGFKEAYRPDKDGKLDQSQAGGIAIDVDTLIAEGVNAETVGILLWKMLAEEMPDVPGTDDIASLTDAGELLHQAEGLVRYHDMLLNRDPLVQYVESQCMSKRGRFYRVFFHSGSWIDLVPEGSLARGFKLVQDKWQLVEVDFIPLLAEFRKIHPPMQVGT
jgi:DNA invertase Pin-like site-specific DNA recombinase